MIYTNQTFQSGAIREIKKGKGRCDLLTLDIISKTFRDRKLEIIFNGIEDFKRTGEIEQLYTVLCMFLERCYLEEEETAFLELAIHFENGADKYGDNNWQKGLPVNSYIDSGTRHFLKYLRGDTDEKHDIAFLWNIICCIWTCENKPEFNVYKEGD